MGAASVPAAMPAASREEHSHPTGTSVPKDSRPIRIDATVSDQPLPNSTAGRAMARDIAGQVRPGRADAIAPFEATKPTPYKVPDATTVHITTPTAANARFKLLRSSSGGSHRPHSARAFKVLDTWDVGTPTQARTHAHHGARLELASLPGPQGGGSGRSARSQRFQDVRAERTWLPFTSPLFIENDDAFGQGDGFDYVQAQMVSVVTVVPVDSERATTGSTGRATHRASSTPRSEASCTESAASARSSRRLQRSSERSARSSSLSARGAFSPAPNSVSV